MTLARRAVAVVLAFAVIGVAAGLSFRRYKRFQSSNEPTNPTNPTNPAAPNANVAFPAPTPSQTVPPDITKPSPDISPTEPQTTESPETIPEPSPASPPSSFVGSLNLIIPVAGVRPEQLIDTFADARSEGRVHEAIDIPAAFETPVLAAADGQIVKLFHSERGGTTIYQSSPDKKLIFYYAHLARYADGLAEGKYVRQGETIAYVGDTGNAGPGNYHLHFSISVVADPKRYWEGTNINPYPLMHR